MNSKSGENCKETKYCKLMKSYKLEKDNQGYQYAIEKILVKNLQREEIRICLYKDMRDRSGSITSRMLVRPVDLTEDELLKLLVLGIECGIISNKFISKMNQIGGK